VLYARTHTHIQTNTHIHIHTNTHTYTHIYKHTHTQMKEQGKALFGSGWVWLIVQEHGKLAVMTTANQDNPLMSLV